VNREKWRNTTWISKRILCQPIL